MNPRTYVVLFVLLCSVLVLPAGGVGAQQRGETPFTLRDLGYDTITMRGMYSSTEFFIPGPGAVETTAASTLRLHFMYTDQLRGGRSNFSVRLNGHDTGSFELIDGRGGERWVDVPLSPMLIKPDFNSLQFVFYMRRDTDDQVCNDAFDPLLWATIFPDSEIAYARGDALNLDEQLDLAQYPAPIYRTELGPNPPIPVVLPNAPSADTLGGATSLLASLGQAAAGRTLQPLVLNDVAAATQPALVIGTPKDFPWLAEETLPLKVDAASGGFVDAKGEAVAPETGVLQIFAHEQGARTIPMLLVSGANDAAVRRAALTLASRSYAGLLHGTYMLVQQDPDVEALARAGIAPGAQTFGELTASTNDPTVRGRGRSSVSVTFFVPQSYRFEESPRVNIRFSHAAGLDDRSLLIVEVNGTSIASTRLNDNNATGATLTAVMPPSVLRPGANTLAATFDMQTRDDQPCAAPFDDVTWGTVHHDSSISLPFVDAAPAIDLSAPVAPFVRGGAILDTMLVLPEQPTVETISQTLTLATQIGAEAKSDMTYLPVALTNTNTGLAAQNLIVVGTPATQPMINTMQSTLPLQFNADGKLEWRGGTTDTPNAQVLLSVQNEQPVGILQIARSPWNRDRSVLLVSGTSPDAISWAVEAITTSRLNGNVALVTADEHVSTLSVRQESAVNVTTIRDGSPLWIAVIAGVIALALVGVTIFLALRSMRTQTQEAH